MCAHTILVFFYTKRDTGTPKRGCQFKCKGYGKNHDFDATSNNSENGTIYNVELQPIYNGGPEGRTVYRTAPFSMTFKATLFFDAEYRTYHAHHLFSFTLDENTRVFSSKVSHFIFLFIPFGVLSWLLVSFVLHVKYTGILYLING